MPGAGEVEKKIDLFLGSMINTKMILPNTKRLVNT